MTEVVKQDLDMDISHMKVLKDWLGDSLTQKAFKKSIDIAIESMEKQIPMKIKEIHVDEYYCPACGAELNCNDAKVEDKYCSECGQRLCLEEGGTSD